ncbi:MAG: C69 family dipeptidase [Bacteroidales bacterium]|nr:C69 family dipeptidase [Bacteroidales bacterium]
MKHFILLLILVAASLQHTSACTNLIVGKKASKDGSVMCSYNCDGFGFAGSLFYSPAGRHSTDERIAIHGWGPTHEGRYVRQVEYTYNVVGLMNERQVTIVETTFDGRLELQNNNGLLDYFSLMRLALQRSATAREAIRCMAELVEEYGYNSTGESITICDPDEAWIMEIVGKGPGNNGAVWVALRIPDDCISAHANLSRIRLFPKEGECWNDGSITKQKSKKMKDLKSINSKHLQYIDNPQVECVYAWDVVSFAREKGYYKGDDNGFSFRDAYCPIDFENVRYADARVWSFFRHHRQDMDQYLPYINGKFDKCDHMPLWVKPDAPLSLQDVQCDMRDHFEGTPLDMTADMTAGPWGMPIRPLPMHFRSSDSIDFFRERPIATQQSGFTMTCQMRRWLPDDVGGVTWFNCDDANMVAYVPLYCCITQIPDPFRPENNQRNEFGFESAFWVNNWVANMVYPRYSMMVGDLRAAQRELEDYYFANQDSVLHAIEKMTPSDRREFLNRRSITYANMMMERWNTLAKYLIVKYNDQVVKRTDKDGNFQRWGYDTPGYDQSFIDAISPATGNRYRLESVIERRER